MSKSHISSSRVESQVCMHVFHLSAPLLTQPQSIFKEIFQNSLYCLPERVSACMRDADPSIETICVIHACNSRFQIENGGDCASDADRLVRC